MAAVSMCFKKLAFGEIYFTARILNSKMCLDFLVSSIYHLIFLEMALYLATSIKTSYMSKNFNPTRKRTLMSIASASIDRGISQLTVEEKHISQ